MLSQEERDFIRTSAIADRNRCHPHGDGCWRLHWPCRALVMLDDLAAAYTKLEAQQKAQEQESAALRTAVGRQATANEAVATQLKAHRALLAEEGASLDRATASTAEVDETFLVAVQEQMRFLLGAYRKLLQEHRAKLRSLENRAAEL